MCDSFFFFGGRGQGRKLGSNQNLCTGLLLQSNKIAMHSNLTRTDILEHKVSLNIILELNQETDDGIIFLLENLRFYKGMQVENLNVRIKSAISQKL